MPFQKGFLWGAGSSAYQTEGAWDKGGKGESVWDAFCHTPGNIRHGETGDMATDAFHRPQEELSHIKALGLNAYRFSMSWPRIFPQGDSKCNEQGFSYYDKLVDGLLKLGVTPFLTLYHWDMPLALEERGGWLNRDTALRFTEYAQTIVRHFEGRVFRYVTLNEPQCFLMLGYRDGVHAPGKKLSEPQIVQGAHNALLAHGMAVAAMRASARSPLSIGIASTGRICCPQYDTARNRKAAYKATFAQSDTNWMFSHTWLLDALCFGKYPSELSAFQSLSAPDGDWMFITQPTDYIGLNAYNADCVDENEQYVPRSPGFPRTALKWAVTPEVLYYGPHFLYDRYHLPICITENGQSCNDRLYLDGQVHDADRIDFLARYLRQLCRAAEDGIPVTGYFHWSLTDNFEWHSGYDERFGLVYVDFETQKRVLKDSAHWYADVIKSNGAAL